MFKLQVLHFIRRHQSCGLLQSIREDVGSVKRGA